MKHVSASIGSEVQMVGDGLREIRSDVYAASPLTGGDRFVWSFGRIMAGTAEREKPLLCSIWHEAMRTLLHIDEMDDEDAVHSWRWSFTAGEEHMIPCVDMIGGALKELAASRDASLRLVAVENTMSETGLDDLLAQIRRGGSATAELLWRPIAIALGAICREPAWLRERQKVVVIDFGGACVEATPLEIKWKEKGRGGAWVPLRHAFRRNDPTMDNGGLRSMDLSWWQAIERAAVGIAEGAGTERQLLSGPFSNCFLDWFFSGDAGAGVWTFDGDRMVQTQLDPNVRKEAFATFLDNEEWLTLSDAISAYVEEQDAVILCAGLPGDIADEWLDWDCELLDNTIVSTGCSEFLRRLREDLPTYLEAIPGVDIVIAREGEGGVDFSPIIAEGEYYGGLDVPVQPNREYSVMEGMEAFPIIVRRTDWEGVMKKRDVEIPLVEEQTPVIINAELKPGQGHIRLWIEGAEGHEDVFGEHRRIFLDWEDMEEHILAASIPPLGPVRGLIEDDPTLRQPLEEMVNAVCNVEGQVSYQGHCWAFNKLLTTRRVENAAGVKESRAMFGSEPIQDEELSDLVRRLSHTIDQTATVKGTSNNRHRYFSYLYCNAPDDIVQELVDLYSMPMPPIHSWSTAFAPGRLFTQAAQFEVLLDFILQVTGKGAWPHYPDKSYASKYFWAVFRCLCYYEDNVNIPSNKLQEVLKLVANYLEARNAQGWHAWPGEAGKLTNIQNSQKFCLFAALYACRLRERDRGFMATGSPLSVRLIEVIRQSPSLVFPGGFGIPVEQDTLNEFVIRFIGNEADKDDIQLLTGFVRTMA